MKIYTRTGDLGETGLFGGPRVGKDMARVEVYGTVDELSAILGVVRAEGRDDDLDRLLERIQNELFEVGAELATPDPVARDADHRLAEHRGDGGPDRPLPTGASPARAFYSARRHPCGGMAAPGAVRSAEGPSDGW